MSLSPGTRLGPYQILAPIGAGGMGEVYRARDTRLDREVAVKVLPQHLSANPEVRARFEREAKTISSLNHPHICVLHDVGREGDTDYLVMELIEGETLAARLAKGALPVTETLRIGSQIADALDRAHRAGVVHRDLKPGNIMLTRGGAKLMDFGLARATGMAGPASGSGVTVAALTQSPTMAQPLTAEGTIVGTFQYMSPEQLEGKETDARSDLWAFGCVLYEMATGKRAFDGKSQASLIGAIMHADPAPISQLAPMTPPELDRVVRACLVKDADDRVQSAHDLKLQLKWLADGGGASAVAPAPGVTRPRRSPLNYLALVTAIGGLLFAAYTVFSGRNDRGPRTPATAQRYILGTVNLSTQCTPVISPGGSYVVLSVRENMDQRICRRNLDSFEIVPVAGTEGGSAPFLSPDGAWLGFVTATAIKKVPVSGGIAQSIVEGVRANSADWSKDGMIYFTQSEGGGGINAVMRVRDAGGTPEVVADLDTTLSENDAWLPEVLPNGTVIYSVSRPGAFVVKALRPDGTSHDLVKTALLGRYCEPGYLFYWGFDSRAVFVVPFDAEKAEITGAAVPLTEEVDGNFTFDVSDNGTLVYVPTPDAGRGAGIVWINRDGASAPAIGQPGPWAEPRLSPDGRRIIVRKIQSDCELWMFDIERGSLARVVQGGDNHDPVWSPDGRRVAYRRGGAPNEIRVTTVDGARETATVVRGGEAGVPSSWSEGGNRLAYAAGAGGKDDIWTVVMDGASQPQRFLETEFDESDPILSRDGRWMAYVSDETSTDEVFVRQFPDAGVAWQISVGGGQSPLWARDGKELYYASGTSMMMVKIQTEPSFRASTPVKLFDGGFSTSRSHDFDAAPGGRFLANGRPGGDQGQQELRILVNWRAELDRLPGAAH